MGSSTSSMGNPYATTHVTRPFDAGKYDAPEHPFEGLARMINGIGQVKKAVPEMTIFASAPTYLRQYADLYTAGAIEQGLCDGMLFGRMAWHLLIRILPMRLSKTAELIRNESV